MDIKQAIQQLIDGYNLSREDLTQVMKAILTGEATPAQISAFLVSLRIKGETIEEITAAADVMRSMLIPVKPKASKLVDIVGTGGDGLNTFNISTASAIVAAAAGVKIAKHGNRAASSQSGSADLLEKAGIRLDMNAQQVADCIDQVGIGFMFAPMHHSAMKYAIGPRKEIGVRTIFNLLGPLTNPASTKRIFIGVYAPHLVEALANVLKELGNEHALVVHGLDGLDEISIEETTLVAEYKNNKISCYEIKPADFGFEPLPLSSIVVKDASQSLAVINAIFAGKKGAAYNAVAMNAGAGIYVSGQVDSLFDGVKRAEQIINSGEAANKFQQYIDFSRALRE